jgi:hypothetical protein
MKPVMRSVCGLTMGLGLVGASLVGPVALDNPTASAAVSVAADEPGVPPGPGPAPNIQGPADQGPAPAPPPERRRHIDGDPIIER